MGGKDFNSNKPLNLNIAGCKVKYSPLSLPIIAHVLNEK